MKYINFLIFILFLINFESSNAENKDLNSKITKNLRCLICQGQSVYDSDSEFANSLKILVDKKLNEGFTEKQIYDFLKNKYGGQHNLLDLQLKTDEAFARLSSLMVE